MTNIEFLVNELRKANETIADLRKENAKIKVEKKCVMEHNARLAQLVKKLTPNVSYGDIDALARLKKMMEQS